MWSNYPLKATHPASPFFFYSDGGDDKMQEEIWKDVPSFEGLYMASNTGLVKSLKRKKEVILSAKPDKYGYCRANLTKRGARWLTSIHRIVMTTFMGPSELTIDHINMNKTDNRLENLEYVSLRENIVRSFESKKSSSKYIGVSKSGKKWAARISVKSSDIYLGRFETEIEAVEAYKKAHSLHFGER